MKTLYSYLKSTVLSAFILITDQKCYKRFRLDYIKVLTNVFSISLLQDDSPCIIHCTCSTNESLITLQKFSTWEVLLNAAKIRNHERILKQAEELKEEEILVLQYRRQCYQQFTHKSSLNVLTKKHEKSKEKFQTIMQNISTYETDERSLKLKRSYIQFQLKQHSSSSRQVYIL